MISRVGNVSIPWACRTVPEGGATLTSLHRSEREMTPAASRYLNIPPSTLEHSASPGASTYAPQNFAFASKNVGAPPPVSRTQG